MIDLINISHHTLARVGTPRLQPWTITPVTPEHAQKLVIMREIHYAGELMDRLDPTAPAAWPWVTVLQFARNIGVDFEERSSSEDYTEDEIRVLGKDIIKAIKARGKEQDKQEEKQSKPPVLPREEKKEQGDWKAELRVSLKADSYQDVRTLVADHFEGTTPQKKKDLYELAEMLLEGEA